MRAILFSVAMLFSVDALACPMADAAAYQAALQEVKATDGTQVAFKVDGMHCGDCSTKVVTALKGVDGVNAAAVDYQTGEAIVSIDSAKTNTDALLAAITEIGFQATKAEVQG